MITDTKKRILGFIHTHKQARAHDLGRIFNISQVAVHKHLKALLGEGVITKVGKPPLVYYIPAVKREEISGDVSEEVKSVIDKNYLYISPTGDLMYGLGGFSAWAKSIKEEKHLNQLAREYIKNISGLDKFRNKAGYIDASDKIKSTFRGSYVDKMFYGDFYSISKFGKTKLGQMVLYAKQSQNRQLVDKLAVLVKPFIEDILKKFSIDAVAFVPPTIPRNLQFMSEFKLALSLAMPEVELVKVVSGEVLVAQKTLSRLEERIENARNSIFVKGETAVFKNILLIDDAAGSGATFNETAGKIKDRGIKVVITFAVVGSMKGFDVIREV